MEEPWENVSLAV